MRWHSSWRSVRAGGSSWWGQAGGWQERARQGGGCSASFTVAISFFLVKKKKKNSSLPWNRLTWSRITCVFTVFQKVHGKCVMKKLCIDLKKKSLHPNLSILTPLPTKFWKSPSLTSHALVPAVQCVSLFCWWHCTGLHSQRAYGVKIPGQGK